MRERTPFGDRLFKARTHAGLSQPQLAKDVGLSQSTLGELEWTGQGSAKVTQIARRCGVRAEWLAEGQGEMLDQTQRLSDKVFAAAAQIDKLPPKWRDWVLTQVNSTIDVGQQSAALEAAQQVTATKVPDSPKRSSGVR